MDDVNLKILACNMRRALRAPEECDIPYLLETAAGEIDQLRAIAEGQKVLRRITEAENDRLRTSRQEAWDEVQRRAEENVKLLDELKAAIGILCLATKPPNSSPSSGT
jgi:hypothetical protein